MSKEGTRLNVASNQGWGPDLPGERGSGQLGGWVAQEPSWYGFRGVCMLGAGEGLHSVTLSEVGPGQTWGHHLQQGVVHKEMPGQQQRLLSEKSLERCCVRGARCVGAG